MRSIRMLFSQKICNKLSKRKEEQASGRRILEKRSDKLKSPMSILLPDKLNKFSKSFFRLLTIRDNNFLQFLMKRVSLFSSKTTKASGEITVEAAFVLPWFFLGFLCFVQLFFVLSIYIRVEMALHQVSKEMGMYAYAVSSLDGSNRGENYEDFNGGIQLPENVLSQLFAKNKMIEVIGKGRLETSMIKDGERGLNVSVQREEEVIEVRTNYNIDWGIKIFHIPMWKINQGVCVRAWTGWDYKKDWEEAGKKDRLVYITESGSVYHERLNCTYLELSISKTVASQIPQIRNREGGKYYPCEKCMKFGNNLGTLYITETGTRYHNVATCTGLKRSIKTILMSERGGRGACTRCGNYGN